MLQLIGVGLVAAGIVVAFFGDKEVGSTKGRVGRLVAWPKGRAKQLKLLVGAALIYAGIMIMMPAHI